MRNAYLIGDGIYLRSLDEEDIDFCVNALNNPAVWHFLGLGGPLNRVREREWVENLYKSPADLALGICIMGNDELIGVTGLHGMSVRDRHAEFGIFLAEPHWGQGYGSESLRMMLNHGFQSLNLHRIFLRVLDLNERALAVYEKAGFHMEGTLRQDTYRDGAYHDIHIMGLLKSEWERGNES